MSEYTIFREKKDLEGVPPRQVLSRKNMRLMGIPAEFWNTKISSLIKRGGPNMDAYKIVRKYIRDIHKNYKKGIGIFFYGSNGVGKTELASIILIESYRARYKCKYTTLNLLTPIGVRSGYDEDIKAEYFGYYLNVDFLVIDEIGKEQQGEKKANITVLEEVMRHRDMAKLPTILITNLIPQDFRERYGESIYSLIFARFIDIGITGEDKRKTVRHKEIIRDIT